MRYRNQTIALLLGVVMLIGTVFATAATANVSSKAKQSSCVTLTKEAKQAKRDVAVAAKEAKDSKGTPDGKTAVLVVQKQQKKAKDLKKRAAKSCAQQAKAKNAATGIPTQATVTETSGTVHTLPLVNADGTVVQGDSTTDPRTPPTYADAKAKGPAQSWKQLVQLMGGQQWYIDGVNARKAQTGFDWSDVQKWAAQTDVDTRVIQVYNLDWSDQQVRDAVRNLIGSDADKLQIARHNCIVNTRGFDHNQMQDFVDCRQMVRVSLSPIIYKDGKAVALGSQSGVFIDCFNIWWIPRQVVAVPSKTPPPVVPVCVVKCSPPPPGCTNCTPPPPGCTNCTPPPTTCNVCTTPQQVSQPVQDDPTGIGHSTVPGAPVDAPSSPVGTVPITGTPAPDPIPGGIDSGSPTGGGTPGGSVTTPDGSTIGGGPTPPPAPPVPVDGGTYTDPTTGF